MSHPGSSPSPLPTFQETDGASPKELLSFLQDYTAKLEHDSIQELLHEKRGKALSLLDNLDRDFLLPFPLPSEYSWNTLHEKIKLSEVIFDMLYRMARRCGEVLCLQENIARSILTKLLNMAISLDVWIDVQDLQLKEGYATPERLYTNCILAASGMLHAFKEGVAIDHGGPSGWKILRAVTEECSRVCRDVLSVPQSGAFYIHLFTPPRIHLGMPPPPPASKAARESEAIQDRTKRTFIHVHNPTQIPLLLTLLLEVQLNALSTPSLGECFAKSFAVRTAELVRQVHEFLISPACITSDARRARAITRLVVSVSTNLQAEPPFNAIADAMRLHLLVRRLSDGPVDAWDNCDKMLLKAFSAPYTCSILRADARSIFMLLKEEQWEERGFDLRALAATYLQMALLSLDPATVHELGEFLRQNSIHPSYVKLLQAIEENTAAAALRSIDPQLQDIQVVDDVALQWKQDVRKVVQAIIEPDDLDWMDDDDEDMDDAKFIERALSDIENRFERPIYNPSAEGRVALARQLTRLPCALARHVDTPCPPSRTTHELNPLKTCVLLVTCILEGTEHEITASVRRAAYVALARSIRHQTVKCDNAGLDHIAQLAARGMKDLDRHVRLSAGRCLAELIRLHVHFENGASVHLDPIFSSLQNALTGNDERFTETALIIVGNIAKLSEPDVLRRAIFCILLAIGNLSPLVRGVAYMQIQAIAKHHDKSVYNLLSPDMDLIAPHLVSRVRSHPQALLDICSLMSTPPPSFLTVTLSHTLPPLFAGRERESLETVSREVGMRLHEMFLNHASRILAEVFMQTKPGKTKHALNFIVEILAEASSGSRDELDAQHVVRGQIVEVIGDIALKLGDPDDDVVQVAKTALVKVQRTAENRTSQYDTIEEAVQALLQQHMLGIVSQLNDYLQEVHGKQSVDGKRRIIKSLGVFIDLVGSTIQGIAPQIMATMQTSLVIPELSETTLEAWNIFLRTLKPEDLSPHVGPTTATFVIAWPTFTPRARDIASGCFQFLIHRKSNAVEYLDGVADFSSIPELKGLWKRVRNSRTDWSPHFKLRKLLDRVTSDNAAVISCALLELKSFLIEDDEQFIRGLTSGDVFDPLVGHIMTALFSAASRDLEGSDIIHQSALECIGIVGAVDPDRFKFGGSDGTMIVKHNFEDESESMTFATHLIRDVLVGAFRSTCDIAYQNFLAYAIQELLRFCRFSSSLVTPGSSGSLPLKVRTRWKELPRAVKETVAPLLAGRYAFRPQPPSPVEHPIYPRHTTYRDWIQAWAACLLHRTSGRDARTIFSAFHPVVRNKDVGVAHHLLPHLVLNILLSDDDQHMQDIRTEILAVLEDQINTKSPSSIDKKRFSAQAIFMLMDHLNRWVRIVRQDVVAKQQRKKIPTEPDRGTEEYQLLRVDSILTSIDQSLIAKAALQCRAYARALMCFEQQLVSMRDTEVATDTKIVTYETMHEIYAQLDEPDGMEGISALVLTPSLEHQIREHESTGRWTSAQSCWEVRLQHSPGDLKSHIGLLRCLKNLGHYDTMRTHVDGLLMRNQTWGPDLLEYQLESDYTVGNWEEVESVLDKTQQETSSVLVARVLLALRSGNVDRVESALSTARKILGAPISAAGARDYTRAYQSILDLHMLHEVHIIFQEAQSSENGMDVDARLDNLQRRLALRLDSTLPSFRSREPLLSMRRTALTLQLPHHHEFKEVIGRSWLLSARLARKAGYWQTAYSAILQSRRNHAPFLFIQSAKLSKATGEPLKALQEVENSLKDLEALAKAKDDTIKAGEAAVLKSKVTTLRARWLGELDRHDPQYILKELETTTKDLASWESGWFHYGHFHDECASALVFLPKGSARLERRLKMNLSTIRSFAFACSCGSKHIYQALSRLLTLWLNVVGEDEAVDVYASEEYKRILGEVTKAGKSIPLYKWYTALPQIISRVGHKEPQTYSLLQRLIRSVTLVHPSQGLWQLISVVKSNQPSRRNRGLEILHKLKAQGPDSLPQLIEASMSLCEGLLGLCNTPLGVNEKAKSISMSKVFPKLYKMLPLPVIIPLQESLRAVLPSTPSAEAHHQPFPLNAPTFHEFEDDVEIMRSLARPRKLTITGSDGKTYIFLGKPKDDLRKDARLMDFNAIINKQLKSNSESRRRQLYIRTYGVVTLNEECGFIQWVPDTTPIRFLVAKYYQARGLQAFDARTQNIFDKLGTMRENDAAELFKREILSRFRPVMHEWFVETFPEPAAWLSSRIAYTRTSAVMSMVGFILGLGDRHCENILLDTRSGDAVHVDFNCLFEKGKTLQTPERVPFRLTQNVVDGFGVTGVEGPFRIACEITMQALRDNCECLSTVLDAFIHDPLVEWQDAKREKERSARRGNQVKESTDLVGLARSALEPIRKKLKGIYSLSQDKALEKEIPVSSMVEVLLTEATDLKNLSKMYIGWSPYF